MSLNRPHESAALHVTGEALFIDDRPQFAGLHAMVFASTVPHACILRRDAARARALPGVHAVLFADDVPGHNQIGAVFPDEPLLATDSVHCVGQAVAVVYAENRARCRAALACIEVTYEPLPAVLDFHDALDTGCDVLPQHRIERGQPDQAIHDAPHRLNGTLDSGGQEHFYLETQAAIARVDDDQTVQVWSSTQHPSETQHLVGHVLGLSSAQVIVHCPRMGGGFGGKETQASPYACLAALGAWVTKKSVTICLDREDDMRLTGGRHPFFSRYEVGFDDEGALLGLTVHSYADAGWAADLSAAILDRALFHLDNAYWLPHVRLLGDVVRSNHMSNCAFRGFGGPQGALVIERIIERVAHALGVDPLVVRQRNLYRAGRGEHTPYGQQVKNLRLERMMSELLQSADYHKRRSSIARFNATHAHKKRAISVLPVKFGISFTASFLNQAGALVLIYRDGSVQLNHGGTEMGQGLYTKMLSVCERSLGVDSGAIRHRPTSTDKVPNTSATAASSGSDLNGAAIADACKTLVARLRPVAATLLGCSVEAVGLRAHRDDLPEGAWAACEGRSVGFAQVVEAAYFQQISLSASGFYRTPDIAYDRESGRGTPFHYFAFGVSCMEVELCGFTGDWSLRRADILHDVGESLLPEIDRGQVEGAFVQGMGWLTLEELRWDAKGTLVTHGPSTYKIPAIGDAPADFRVSLLQKAPQPGVIYGSKAVGEPPFLHGIAVHNALSEAVRAFGGGGWLELPVPATGEALLMSVEQIRGVG